MPSWKDFDVLPCNTAEQAHLNFARVAARVTAVVASVTRYGRARWRRSRATSVNATTTSAITTTARFVEVF